MNDLLAKENEYRYEVAIRAIAHEDSAEWHRRRGTSIGVVATVLSALVGSSVFATVAGHIKDGNINVPTGFWPSVFYFFVALCLIVAPALSGLQTYLNDPEQAEKHRVTSAGYYHLQQQLDLLQLKYRNLDKVETARNEVLERFEQIADQIENLRIHSITLTQRATDGAKRKLVQQQLAAPSSVAASAA